MHNLKDKQRNGTQTMLKQGNLCPVKQPDKTQIIALKPSLAVNFNGYCEVDEEEPSRFNTSRKSLFNILSLQQSPQNNSKQMSRKSSNQFSSYFYTSKRLDTNLTPSPQKTSICANPSLLKSNAFNQSTQAQISSKLVGQLARGQDISASFAAKQLDGTNESISKRLKNLKKFYTTIGPPVDPFIVTKQLNNQQRKQQAQSPTNQTHQGSTMMIQVDSLMKKPSKYEKILNCSTQINLAYKTPTHYLPPNSPPNSTSMHLSSQIHNHSTHKSHHQFSANLLLETSASANNAHNSLSSRFLNSKNEPQLTKKRTQIQKMDFPFNQNLASIQEGNQMKISTKTISSKEGKSLLYKNTEKYFKQEILKAKYDFSKKFLLCAQYEAHRNFKSDPLQAEKVYLQTLDGLQHHLAESLKLVSSALKSVKDISETDTALNELNNIVSASKFGYLQIIFLLLQAKVCFEYRDYVKSIYLAKRSKNLAQTYGYLHEKMKNYELIARGFNMLQKHKISVIYQVKLSWLLQNENHELQAYDSIGKCYYYLGDLERAYYFHEKMMTGELETDQGIKSLSNSKLQNRGYQNNQSHYFRKIINAKKNMKDQNTSVTEEEELVSSSDDEFEIQMNIKSPTEQEQNQQNQAPFDGEYGPNSFEQRDYKQNSQNKKTWADKLIMAKLNVIQLQRVKEMTQLQKRRSVLQGNTQDTVGKAECKLDLKNQEYLEKLLQQRGKSTTIQRKYRISHLSPNRNILSYHEAEAQFLKLKNYSSMQDFIPTIDLQNVRQISQNLVKIKKFLTSVIPLVQLTLISSPVFQKLPQNSLNKRLSHTENKQASLTQLPTNQDFTDLKFKKISQLDSIIS